MFLAASHEFREPFRYDGFDFFSFGSFVRAIQKMEWCSDGVALESIAAETRIGASGRGLARSSLHMRLQKELPRYGGKGVGCWVMLCSFTSCG